MKFDDNDFGNWAKRKLIAEVCGWTLIEESGCLNGQLIGYPPFNPIIGQKKEIPDYFWDLNDMHEAEVSKGFNKVSYDPIVSDYHGNLMTVVGDDNGERTWCSTICATAAQRAKAFGLTLKLWT